MIFDRTQADVDEAKQIIEKKVKKFEPLTVTEVDILEKGCITASTLNRIESKALELRGIIVDMGYYMPDFEVKEWGVAKVFTDADFARILDNIRILREAFYAYADTPDIPEAVYTYSSANDIEKILHDLEDFSEKIKETYIICGEYICGGA